MNIFNTYKNRIVQRLLMYLSPTFNSSQEFANLLHIFLYHIFSLLIYFKINSNIISFHPSIFRNYKERRENIFLLPQCWYYTQQN